LTNIQAQSDSYPASIMRVADEVLHHPHSVPGITISQLARTCRTSETSVVRFCRTLGFSGYAPFKLQMAAELAAESAQFGEQASYGSDIILSDTLGEMVAKISASERFGILETSNNLDLDALQSVIDSILTAEKALAFGVGASNASAHDLVQKLQRIGRAAWSEYDAHNALVVAALLHAGDVAIGFSHSGATREVAELLQTARAAGATTVAITNTAGSLVTQHADITLRTAVRETPLRAGAMASRIAQLTIVDYIFVGVARANHDDSIQALEVTHESVRALRGAR